MGHKILVTGGAGYLGSTMVPELLKAGNQVTVLDNFFYHQNSLAHVCHDTNLKVINGDIRLKEIMTAAMSEADIIIPGMMISASLIAAVIISFRRISPFMTFRLVS